LLELLIVICVMAIIAAIAGIIVPTWVRKYSVERQTREVYTDLMNARAMAMERNKTHFVDLAAGSYTVYEDTNEDGTLETASDIPRIAKTLTYPVTWPAGWTAANPLEFDSRGIMTTLPTNKGTIRVTTPYGADLDCIYIVETRIRMGQWDGAQCAIR
jgi:Tfp pilus assembly protein FimT